MATSTALLGNGRRQVASAPCGSAWRSRSTTTRSRASRRCDGTRSSTTRAPRSAPGTTRSGCRTTCSSMSRSTAARTSATACTTRSSALGALARVTTTVRLGTLVLCEAFRPASVLAKSLATIDRLSGGRLDVGIGAGWYEPEYEAIGMTMPSPGVRIARLREAIIVCAGLLGGGPFTFDGTVPRGRRRSEHTARAPAAAPAGVRRREG